MDTAPPAATVLVAEDETNLRRVIVAHLKRDGYAVLEAEDGAEAQALFRRNAVDVVVTDLKMSSDEDGMEVLRFVSRQAPRGQPPVPVILLTAHGTADKALEAIAQGAYNLISKPCDMEELKSQVAGAVESRRGRDDSQNEGAGGEGEERLPGRFGMIGKTEAMLKIFETIETVADSPSTVLLLGESGTGKELVAEAIHRESSRTGQPFIKLNSAAIPENLVESELFGHERGAFTGAVTARIGKMEQADGGTLLLDEIGDLRPDIQVKLLRALQSREIERVGGSKTIQVNVRVVAATHRDLPRMVKAGEFREDLYYRLNVVPIQIPPLRERREDIPLLLEHFRRKYNKRLGKEISHIDPTLSEALSRLPWPGNIRELEGVMERMVLFSNTHTLGVRDLPGDILKALQGSEGLSANRDTPPTQLPPGATLKDVVKEETNRLERDLIRHVLEEAGWNVTRSAERLGLSRKGLQMKMKDLDLRRGDGKGED